MRNPLFMVFLLLSVLAAAPAMGTPAGTQPSAGLAATPGYASTTTPKLHERIAMAVAGFVQQQTAALPGKIAYQVDEIDHRLALPACASIEAFLPAGSKLIGKSSVGVRCNEPGGWNIFVPVQIRVSLDLVVSSRQLPLGHTLQERDLTSLATETTQMAGLSDPRLAIGKVLRYSIAAGQVIREDMLRSPFSVTQGQIVQLVAQGSGFSINNEGSALNNASEGQTVQVRVGASRVIGGIARSSGVVEIGSLTRD